MGFRTIFIESRCKCSYQGGYMVVRKEDGVAKVHLSEISSVVLGTTQAYLSAHLLMELAKAKVPVVVSDEKKNPVGEFLPLYGSHNPAKHVHDQLKWGEPIKKRVWQRIVQQKIGHQADVLQGSGLEDAACLLRKGAKEVRSGDVTNREAWAARIYFTELFGEGFTRSDDCQVNAALNYGYAILLSMVNREVVSRGYLTQVGIFHRNEYNPFNLSCDFMEPFRPLVDKMVVESHRDEFGKEQRVALAGLGGQWVTYHGGRYKISSVVSSYVQSCINALGRECDVDEIETFEL